MADILVVLRSRRRGVLAVAGVGGDRLMAEVKPCSATFREFGRPTRAVFSVAYRDPPLCPVCRVNHVGWWITSKGQHFDPYCAACGFEPTDGYRADIDPVFRDMALRRAIERSRG